MAAIFQTRTNYVAIYVLDLNIFDIMIQMYKCSKCLIEKPKSEFYVRNNRKCGVKSACKQCSKVLYETTAQAKINRAKSVRGGGRFSHARSAAKRGGHEWLLTKEEFNYLSSKSCEYCGGNTNNTGSGLDRKDCTVGYIINNVVPCCHRCNSMKWNYWSYEEMLQIGMLVKLLDEKRKLLDKPNV